MKKTIISFIACLAVMHGQAAPNQDNAAENAWNTTYHQIESRIKVPEFKEKTFKAAVKPNASAKQNQQAINKAITVSNENPIIAAFKIESHKDKEYKIKVNDFSLFLQSLKALNKLAVSAKLTINSEGMTVYGKNRI